MKSWVRGTIQGLVAAAACGYIAYEVYLRSTQLVGYFGEASSYARIGACGLGYGASLLLVAAAWRGLVQGLKADSEPRLSLGTGLTVFALSNMLKYLPTNVLHVAGRYTALRRLEFGRQTAILSLIAEPVLMVVLATILVLSIGYPAIRASHPSNLFLVLLALAVMLAAAVAGTAFALRRDALKAFVRSIPWQSAARAAGYALPCHFIFFLWSGALLAALLNRPIDGLTLASVIGVSASAWTVGLVTPGLPAGLGVREAIIVAGLTRIGYAGDAFIAAMAFRLATTVGDCLAALAAGLALAASRRIRATNWSGRTM